jgi:hypothetical protein
MRAFISALLACAILSGCATTYVGPQPDFKKTGAEAQVEYEKFEAGTDYGDFNLYSIRMGKKDYYRETVEPIVNQVSPAAASKLERMQTWNYVGWGIFAAMMVTIFQPYDSWAHQTGYWIGFAGLVATSLHISFLGTNAAEDYNKDLKAKFTPSLAISKTF